MPAADYLRLLLVNSDRLYALRAGIGPGGDRYTLHPLTAAAIPKGAELVSCYVVPACRGRVRTDDEKKEKMLTYSKPGIVCLAMLSPQHQPTRTQRNEAQRVAEQGDAAAGPAAVRPISAAPVTAEPVLGLLNVYELRGDVDVPAAVQREPQQIELPYAPVGVTHVTVWRNTPPNFAGAPADDSTERGETVLVWGNDGLVHGFTLWASGVGGDEARNNHRGAMIKEETPESLKALIPELNGIESPVLSLSAEVIVDAAGARRRRLMVGCADGVRLFSLDVASGQLQGTFCSNLNGCIAGAILATSDSAFSTPTPEYGSGGGITANDEEIVGFACGSLGLVTCFTQQHASKKEFRGSQQSPPLPPPFIKWAGAAQLEEGANVLCLGCADFCRDDHTSVALGTSCGTIIVCTVSKEGGGRRQTQEEEVASVDDPFGMGWREDPASYSDVATPQDVNESLSPRLPGTERQQQRSVAGSGSKLSSSLHANTKSRHKMLTKWERHVPYPVWGIASGDFNHDGISEMVVASMHGVHVFQPDYREEATRLRKTLDALQLLQPAEENEGGEQGEIVLDHVPGDEPIIDSDA